MNTATNFAALYLADIPNDQEDLEKVVSDYPVSAVARFLFLYQLKKNKDSRFNEVAKQTGIYLNNPYWMEFQLRDSSRENGNDSENNLLISPEITEKAETDETTLQPINTGTENSSSPIEENVHEELPVSTFEEEILLPAGENITDEELPQPVNEQIIKNSILENQDSIDQNIEEEIKEQPIISNENAVVEFVVKQNDEESSQPVNEEIIENPVLENEEFVDQNIDQVKKEDFIVSNENAEEEIVEKQSEEELSQPVNEQITENPVLENEEFVDQNIDQVKKEDFIVSNENATEELVEKQNNEELPQPVNEQIIENPVLDNKDLSNQNIEHEIKEESAVSNEEEEEEEDHDEIPFEPLHTVDYFASQGIKLNEEALNNDQLGKQVKSFTAWLKSMKKLHPGQLPEQNEVIERLIQTSSEVSNQNVNVLTEAMAEVLVKQGKSEKAIEMYQKLSLLNPSKSAYFAAKIEILKVN
ncbi:MAG: hypothetical protein ABI136_01135 [Ginsengibacter sp.]